MKLSTLKLSVLCGIVAVLAIFISFKMVQADAASNAYGYFWSSNIGWISLNDCTNPQSGGTGCDTNASYGVNVSPIDGTLSGYAWSSNIGWITFNPSGCPTTGCTPGAKAVLQSDGTYSIVGWARACSVYVNGCSGGLNDDAVLGTWDGYIALDSNTAGGSGGSWGLTIGTDRTIGGYAWGSNVIGWIKSITGAISDANGPQVQLVANPPTIKRGDSSTLTVTATNIDGPNSCSFVGIASGLVMKQQADDSWLGTLVVSPTVTTPYTVKCTKGTETASASATVTVTYIITPPTHPGGGGGGPGGPGSGTGSGNDNYCANTFPQFAWDSDAASCTISEAGSSTKISVAGSSTKQQGATLGTDGLYYYTPNLAVIGSSSVYTLQCTGGSQPISIPITVPLCAPTFSPDVTLPSTAQACSTGTQQISALGVCQSLVTSSDGKTMTATFNATITPFGGFSDPVDLSLGSLNTSSLAIPNSPVVFAPATITLSGGQYGQSQFTVSVPVTKDLKLGDVFTSLVYFKSEITGLTEHVQIGLTVGGSITIDPIYKEF
jgi:hypothetical protein